MSKEQQAALDTFADVHSDVVRKIAAGNATLIDMERLRAKAWELERTDNDVLAGFGHRALAHIELAFKAMRLPDGRRKRRLAEKMQRKGQKLGKYIEKQKQLEAENYGN